MHQRAKMFMWKLKNTEWNIKGNTIDAGTRCTIVETHTSPDEKKACVIGSGKKWFTKRMAMCYKTTTIKEMKKPKRR